MASAGPVCAAGRGVGTAAPWEPGAQHTALASLSSAPADVSSMRRIVACTAPLSLKNLGQSTQSEEGQQQWASASVVVSARVCKHSTLPPTSLGWRGSAAVAEGWAGAWWAGRHPGTPQVRGRQARGRPRSLLRPEVQVRKQRKGSEGQQSMGWRSREVRAIVHRAPAGRAHTGHSKHTGRKAVQHHGTVAQLSHCMQ